MPKTRTSPPRSSLPLLEQEICGRLRTAIKQLGVFQRFFAQRINIPEARLKSYLAARAPIRAKLARKICAEFNINERWLATGKLPAGPAVYFPFNGIRPDEERQLFSQMYETMLQGRIEGLMHGEEPSSAAESKSYVSGDCLKLTEALSQVRTLIKDNSRMAEGLFNLSKTLDERITISVAAGLSSEKTKETAEPLSL